MLGTPANIPHSSDWRSGGDAALHLSAPHRQRRRRADHVRAVFTVVEGKLGFQRAGEPERFAGAGETVAFAAGEGHRFWNAGIADLRTTAHIEPADNAEYILTELFASSRRNRGRGPDPFDTAFLMTRYRNEFAVLAPPRALQRLLFPVLVALGTVLGRFRKFSDAPPPIDR